MKKLELLVAAGWTLAGLLALRMVLRAPVASRTEPLVETIRTSCELPAGTVVFVVRDQAEEAP